MRKEKVYIVLSHRHSLKGDNKLEWVPNESIEFVSQLRKRHYTTSSAIADYINRKMITGKRVGMEAYANFEKYVTTKYASKMAELDTAFGENQVEVVTELVPTTITDTFGNVREPTVFDVIKD